MINITLICDNCHKPYHPFPRVKDAKKSNNVFCSMKCHGEFRRKQNSLLPKIREEYKIIKNKAAIARKYNVSRQYVQKLLTVPDDG